MPTNSELDKRRENSVARAVAYAQTFAVARAREAEIWDVEGNRYIDFCGGIGCQNVGHRHPDVIAAIKKQLDDFTHTCFQISPYAGYVELAERLNALAPGDWPKKSLFFSAGAEAVENAVKIARYYTGRPALVAFTNGYHGRSYMGMGLSSRMAPFKIGFRPFPTEIYRVPFTDPYHGVSLADTERAFESLFVSDVSPDQVAAVILEPVQGEGGFNVAQPGFMDYVRTLCDRHGIVMIADEIQSGFGRTGRMFAMEHFDIAPDLTCVGKSMGGGLPLSGVVGRADIIDSVPPGALGGTFGGNPVACAAGLAVLDVFAAEDVLALGSQLGQVIDAHLRRLADDPRFPCIGDVRGLGCMNAMELVEDRVSNKPDAELTARVINIALRQGLVLVAAGQYKNVIRILVPITAPVTIVNEGLSVLESALDQAVRESSKAPARDN